MSSRSSKSTATVKSVRTQHSNHAVLERVLGFTLVSNSAVSLDSKSGSVAYAAGCVVVLRSPHRDQQRFIQSSYKKSITAIEFSPDGDYIATGEAGHQPMVRIWSVTDGIQLTEFAGHHFRVIAVRFNPSGRYLVSLGSQEDNTLYVWDRTSGQRIASAKISNKVNGVTFSPDGQFFVTVGVRHIRFWYLESKRARNKETVPLNGRNAILGDLLNNSFMDVCCVSQSADRPAENETQTTSGGQSSDTLTLVVSKAGQLLQFNAQRYLDKWVELRTSRASCLSVCGSWVAVGCARGTCLLFNSITLQFLAQLPLPHQLGREAQLLSIPATPPNASRDSADSPLFPDMLAVKLDGSRARVICFYSDHSLYIWNMADLANVQCTMANYYHSRGVWSIDCLSETKRSAKTRESCGTPPNLCAPPWWSDSMFVTCADDGTVRFWDLSDELIGGTDETVTDVSRDSSATLLRDTLTDKLRRIIFTDPTNKYLCVDDRLTVEFTFPKFEAGVGPLGGPSPALSPTGQNESYLPSPSSHATFNLCDSATSASNNLPTSMWCCVRTVCLSPDCQHLAVGDREGNLRVYLLESLELISQIAAHDSEILSLSFFRSESVPELTLLCSASRDRLIHIFDPNQDYSLVQTVADHSASIFAARIIETEEDGEIRLISCGMDKSLLIRILEPDDAGLTAHFALEHHLVGRHSQMDAAFTPTLSHSSENKPPSRKRYLAVACQDRRLRIYNVGTGRQVRCYRGSFNEEGCLVRCSIDPTGSIVATSGSDKQLNLFYLLSGESIATVFGHSELTVGLRFLPTLRHLVSVSSDSCIFVWRLSPSLFSPQLGDRPLSVGLTGVHVPVATSHGSLRLSGSLSIRRGFRDKQINPETIESFISSRSTGDSPTDLDRVDNLKDGNDCNSIKFGVDDVARNGLFSPILPPDSSNLLEHIHRMDHTLTACQKDVPMKRPAFYFSVSALPAWARRKLSRRSSVALVMPSITQINATPTGRTVIDPSGCMVHSEEPTSLTACGVRSRPTSGEPNVKSVSGNIVVQQYDIDSPQSRIQCTDGLMGSYDSLSSTSNPRTDHSVPSFRCVDLMSCSEYRPSDTSASRPHVVHSRSARLYDSRCALSRDASPRGSAVSAPTTPFHRVKSLEHEKIRLGVRCLKPQTLSTHPSVAQPHPFGSQTGSSRCEGTEMLHENISSSSIKSSKQRSSLSSVRASWTADQSFPLVLRSPSAKKSSDCCKSAAELSSNRISCLPGRESDTAIPALENSQTPLSRYHTTAVSTQGTLDSAIGGAVVVESSDKRPLMQLITTKSSHCTTFPSSEPYPLHRGSPKLPLKSPHSPIARSRTPVNAPSADPTASNSDPTYAAPTFAFQQKTITRELHSPITASTKVLSRSSMRKAASALSMETDVPGVRKSNSGFYKGVKSGLPKECNTTTSTFPDDEFICSSDSPLGHSFSHTTLSRFPLRTHSPLFSRSRWAKSPERPIPSVGCAVDDIIHDSPGAASCDSTKVRPVRPTNLRIAGPKLSERQRTFSPSTAIHSLTETEVCTATAEQSTSTHSPHAASCSLSTLIEADRLHTTHQALETLQEALTIAVQRCTEFKSNHGENADGMGALRSVVADELEWRFAKLRAMLGLEPTCVDPPTARVLLADLVERLVPQLRSSLQSADKDGIFFRSPDAFALDSADEWVADSTTENPTSQSGEDRQRPDKHQC